MVDVGGRDRGSAGADVPALAGVDHDVVPATSLVVLGDNAARNHGSRAYGYLDGSRVFGVVRRELPANARPSATKPDRSSQAG
jgi:hypothetical protein